MKCIAFAAVFLLLHTAACNAQETTSFHAYQLRPGIVAEVADTVRALVGTNGTVATDETNGRLMVFTTAEYHAQIAQLLDGAAITPRNIEIAVTTCESSLSPPPPAEKEKPESLVVTSTDSGSRIRLAPHLMEKAAGRNDVVRQTVVVTEGSEASLRISSEAPCSEWLVARARQSGLLAPDLTMNRVAALMSVQPRVLADGITIAVRVVPELSGIIGASPTRILFKAAATELTVKDGETLSLAGLIGDEFYEKFLTGSVSRGQSRHVIVELTPHILSTRK